MSELKYNIDTNLGPSFIEQIVSSTHDGVRTELYRRIIQLEEESIRQALIKLGWTPPDPNRRAPEAGQPEFDPTVSCKCKWRGKASELIKNNAGRFCPICAEEFKPYPEPQAQAEPAEGQEPAEYPECSGDPASCPENEGHGCCKPNPPRPDIHLEIHTRKNGNLVISFEPTEGDWSDWSDGEYQLYTQPQRPADYIEVDGLRVGPAWVRNKLEEQNQRPAMPDVTSTLTDADHLAVMAEKLIAANNALAMAEHTCLIGETAANIAERDACQETFNEYYSGVQSAIYEYRKRAQRYRDQLTAAPAPERPIISDAIELARAAIAYDAAIQASANDPEAMSSFCTAQGETLDSLYDAWISKARTMLKEQPNGQG